MNRKYTQLTLLLLITLIITACSPSVVDEATQPAPTQLPPPTEFPTVIPTEVPTAAATEEPTATTAPIPEAGSVEVSPVDGAEMIYIPAGEFKMGSLVGTMDEQPVHTVTLDAYWIDKMEVTSGMYTACVLSGACLRPYIFSSNTHYDYYDDPRYDNYPVIGLKWSSADTYCKWAGRRLPTEAEWEKAARGTDERTYPWGNTPPNDTLLNFNKPLGDFAAVTEYPFGASPYGVLNMAGNVAEWIADWYAADYYSNSPASNPTGSLTGEYRVVRGGSWYSSEYLIRSADRMWVTPDSREITIGFRCAVSD